MSTIPASELVRVIPNVLDAGGSALDIIGLMLSTSTRLPSGQVVSFPNDGISVSAFFGAASPEAAAADIYFNGFDNSTQKPELLLFSRSAATAASAWLRGGQASQMSLTDLKALSGSLTVVMDGYTYTNASIDLASATSFSAAAALIETGLNDTPPNAASVTGDIAAGTASVTGSIAGNVLTVSAVSSGELVPGAILSGTGITSGTQVTGQLSGVTGGIGTYAVDTYQQVDSTTVSATYGTLTVSAVSSGTLSVGQVLSGSGITAGTQITGLGTGEGLTGTYYVDLTQTAASTSITADGADLNVEYDSVRGSFIINSGSTGPGSTAAYATGTLAAPLFLTSATGATLSQGAAAVTPGAAMDAIVQETQDWATFMLLDDPDGGTGTEQKLLYADWTNDQGNRYAYIAQDADEAPRSSGSATSSFGYLVNVAGYSGTCAISCTSGERIDAFVCGTAASIDFEALNGRITFAFRGQSGLVPDVTNATVANNLIANGYNFYGAYATANDQFRLFQKGVVSGNFQWLDSYINQIWLNNALQLALMNLLSNANSIPYNDFGYNLIQQACVDPINAALNFGSIRAGVTLSAQQASQVNAAAGVIVSDVLYAQGWYLQVKDAAPITRQARESPPINLWYMDGQSVQKIELNSVLIQ